MLNYTGYFDEAGTDANSRVIVVGGYVSPAQDWRRLEIKWRKVLKKAGAAYYHTTDLEANPPRGIYKSWTRERANKLTDCIAPLVKDHIQWGLAVYILREDWFSAFDAVKHLFHNQPHKVPYVLLSRICIEGLIQTLDKKLPRQEKIGFVFEENDFTGLIVEGHNQLAKNPDYGHRFRGIATSRVKEDLPALQAADFFVWHYKRLMEQIKGYRTQDLHRAVRHAIRKDFELRFVDASILKELWTEFVRRYLSDSLRSRSVDRKTTKP